MIVNCRKLSPDGDDGERCYRVLVSLGGVPRQVLVRVDGRGRSEEQSEEEALLRAGSALFAQWGMAT